MRVILILKSDYRISLNWIMLFLSMSAPISLPCWHREVMQNLWKTSTEFSIKENLSLPCCTLTPTITVIKTFFARRGYEAAKEETTCINKLLIFLLWQHERLHLQERCPSCKCEQQTPVCHQILSYIYTSKTTLKQSPGLTGSTHYCRWS